MNNCRWFCQVMRNSPGDSSDKVHILKFLLEKKIGHCGYNPCKKKMCTEPQAIDLTLSFNLKSHFDLRTIVCFGRRYNIAHNTFAFFDPLSYMWFVELIDFCLQRTDITEKPLETWIFHFFATADYTRWPKIRSKAARYVLFTLYSSEVDVRLE